jgi:hypothetical protein
MLAGLNAAVTPVGNPLAARFTSPVNPPPLVMVMLVVPDCPWATETEPAIATVMLGGGGGGGGGGLVPLSDEQLAS